MPIIIADTRSLLGECALDAFDMNESETKPTLLEPFTNVADETKAATMSLDVLPAKASEETEVKQELKYPSDSDENICEDQNYFVCYECGEKFIFSSFLADHIKEHEKMNAAASRNRPLENNFPTNEEIDSSVNSSSTLGQAKKHTHQKQLWMGSRDKASSKVYLHTCGKCGVKFSTRLSLRAHTSSCRSNKQYKCKSCAATFVLRNQLSKHVCDQRGRSSSSNYKCEECHALFKQKDKLVRHLVTHTGERKYSCPVCDKRFTQSGTVKLHLKIHRSFCKVSLNGSAPVVSRHSVAPGMIPKQQVAEQDVNDDFKKNLRILLVYLAGEENLRLVGWSDLNTESLLRQIVCSCNEFDNRSLHDENVGIRDRILGDFKFLIEQAIGQPATMELLSKKELVQIISELVKFINQKNSLRGASILKK